MRNVMNLSAKFAAVMTVAICGLFINTASFAQAPAWTVSKGVQKVSNKKQFEDQDIIKSHIQAMTINQDWAISKGVNSIGSDNVAAKGNISSPGTPGWANSKGVHQIRKSEPVSENKDLFKSGPEITRQGK